MYKGSRFSGQTKASSDDGIPAGPPSFILPIKNCEVVEGSAARFQCQVTGNPEPDVEWYKDGKKLKESKQLTFLYDENDNCKLIITEGRHKDAGEYKVTAVNRHGKVSCTAQLIIKDQEESGESGGEASDAEVSEEESDNEEEAIIRKDKITSLYTVGEELGKGRFGVVCKCVRKTDGKEFAAKFVKCSKAQEKDDVKHEVEIMQAIKHKRLLKLADAFETASEFILVMELVTGGELFERVVEDEFISENDVIYYMKQIIDGVQHMHSRSVLHLDLKPENIMIVRPNSRKIKLIDFGLARKYNPKENLKVMFGTPEFVAPEVLTYDRITPATDLWSVGVIAYVLLSGLSPFMGDNDAETLANVQTAEWDFDDDVFDDISDDAKDFISKVLVLKASARTTVQQCLKHPWLTEKREPGKQLNTNRLKAFTARRKWKKALTAIRSTNFLSRLLGSRGTEDSNSKPGGGAGGGGGLLARVKAMHVAGVQAPESGPASSPFLSPSSAAAPPPQPKPVSEKKPTSNDTASPKTSKSSTPTKTSTTTSSSKPTVKTPNGVPAKAPEAKASPSSKAPESKSKISNDVSSKTSDAKPTPTKDKSAKASESKSSSASDVSEKLSESESDSSDISGKEVKSKTAASKDSTSKAPESKETSTPSKTIPNDTKKSTGPSTTRTTTNRTTPRGGPPAKGKLPQWPPPPKERPQKREIAELIDKYKDEGMPLTSDNPEHEYDIKDEIGRGKFAVIKKCLHKEKKKEFAAKLIKFDDEEEHEAVQEFDVHRTLDHPNIISLYSGFIVQKYIVLIIELFNGKDVLNYLASKTKVTEDDVANIIKKVLEALEYLHNQDIIHLDIRPDNIMANEENVKLIDFGCARRLQDKNGEVGAVVGNTEFSAPEMLSFEPVNTAADMWSLGVTTYLLLGAELPFLGQDDDAVTEAVTKGTFFFDEDLFSSTTNNAKDFIKSLICKIPRKRMDATTAKEHAWLSPSFGRERRKTPAAEPERFKEIIEDLISQEEDELVAASCVLRTFEEEPYESSEDDEDEDDE